MAKCWVENQGCRRAGGHLCIQPPGCPSGITSNSSFSFPMAAFPPGYPELLRVPSYPSQKCNMFQKLLPVLPTLHLTCLASNSVLVPAFPPLHSPRLLLHLHQNDNGLLTGISSLSISQPGYTPAQINRRICKHVSKR